MAKRKVGTVSRGIRCPITSRNRFSVCLKGTPVVLVQGYFDNYTN